MTAVGVSPGATEDVAKAMWLPCGPCDLVYMTLSYKPGQAVKTFTNSTLLRLPINIQVVKCDQACLDVLQAPEAVDRKTCASEAEWRPAAQGAPMLQPKTAFSLAAHAGCKGPGRRSWRPFTGATGATACQALRLPLQPSMESPVPIDCTATCRL